MRKIIGIGETLFDIVFKNGQPVKSVPGGAIFNAIVSLGRTGMKTSYISEVGRDNIGTNILSFMTENGVSTENMYTYYDGKSPVSLLFINENGEISTDTYLSYPESRLDIVWPRLDADDIIIFGSFYSLNPQLRQALTDLLTYAHERKAMIYYDVDFHKYHVQDVIRVMPSIIENLEFSSIVHASRKDMRNIYKEDDVDKVYKNNIKFFCNVLICSDGPAGIEVRTPHVSKHYDVPAISAPDKVGVGDALNAGILYALIKNDITLVTLPEMEEKEWDKVIATGIAFAAEVCGSEDAFISQEFSKKFKV